MNENENQGLDKSDFKQTLNFMSECRLVMDISFHGITAKINSKLVERKIALRALVIKRV